MKYQLPPRFAPFQVEHKEREGSLHLKPGAVVELTEADVAAIKTVQPNVVGSMFALPVPKVKPDPEPKYELLKVEESEGLSDLEDENDDEDWGNEDED